MTKYNEQLTFLRSPLFLYALVFGVLAALVLTLALGIRALWFVEHEQQMLKEELLEFKQEILDIYHEDGAMGVREEFGLERLHPWNIEETREHFSENELVFSVLNKRGQLIAGAALGGDFNIPWQRLSFELEEETVDIISHHFAVGEQFQVGLSRITSWITEEAWHEFTHLALWLWLTIPLLFSLFGLLIAKRQIATTLQLTTEIEQLITASKLAPLTMKGSASKMASEPISHVRFSINQLIAKMSAMHQDIETMSVGIAHDLKTPLSRVANRLQLMQQDIDDPRMTAEHLEQCIEQVNVVISTFTSIVRLSEIESGQRKQSFSRLNLSTLIQEMAENYEPLFSDSGRTLDISVVDDVYCSGDKDLLNQMLNNLLENALEYSEANAKVWIRLQHHTSGVLLQVGDSGPGISTSDQERVFSRFYRGDISRNKPGNGLGLSIVKAIVNLHDAPISILPKQAGVTGAVFNIVIPISH
ncbi:sensor histidine kinase [Thalassotalea euphylliae]|uniref:histidine kinase n=1 Tax=Thalassotalea euphylliae TaxID=1655234 RepID=A0A3E0UEK5_9GAMM|nr:HAMP domain-containing sensor histidine kinase [Thalassotalea euphylliae]REL35013.1 sensor histidine kinase [Thalassotalea euphylliae]